MKKMEENRNLPVHQEEQKEQKEYWFAFSGAIMFAIQLLVVAWGFPTMIEDEVYQGLYLAYMRHAPVIMHSHGEIFAVLLYPALVMILPIYPIAILKAGFKVDLSPYQRYMDMYMRALCYAAIMAFLLAIPVNLFIVQHIEKNGYASCPRLHESGVIRKMSFYVISPELCVDKNQLQQAIERYEQTNPAFNP